MGSIPSLYSLAFIKKKSIEAVKLHIEAMLFTNWIAAGDCRNNVLPRWQTIIL